MDIEKLVRKAQKGNDKAYLKLFQHYEETIYRTAYVYVKNQDDALDIVQETAYQSFKSIEKLKEPAYFKTWLIRITINCSINLLRQKKKVIAFKPELIEQIDSSNDDDILLSITLQDLLNKLEDNEKTVIMLKYYFDYTLQTIAEMMEMPLGTAKTTLYRALKKLRHSVKRGEIS